jgi:hypothetical protein
VTAGAGASGGPGGRRFLAAGLAVATVYVLVALVTPHLSGRPLRPLFDGFAPPAPYAWVNPPPEFAKDNRKPAEANQDVALGPEGSAASNSTTADGQAIAGLDIGSVPVHFPDTSVKVRVTPLDPATLGALPAGLRPEGNAYRVTFTYQPSGQVITTLAKPGTIALTGAAPVTSLLFSADGKSWQDTGGRPFGDSNGLFAQLTAPGYYVSASHNAPRAGTAKGGTSPVVPIGIALGVVVVAIVAGVVVSGRRRRSGGGGRGRPRR